MARLQDTGYTLIRRKPDSGIPLRSTFGYPSTPPRLKNELVLGGLTQQKDSELAGIFVPVAGDKLLKDGGIYYVGMATDGIWRDTTAAIEATYENQRDFASKFFEKGALDRRHSPFWQFLDGLSWALCHGPFHKVSDRLGWSNLIKIGWSKGNPNQWQDSDGKCLMEKQREICVECLAFEFKQLRNTMIVIVSENQFSILEGALKLILPSWKEDYNSNWNREFEETGVWQLYDPATGNLYLHCYHPNHAIRSKQAFWGSALGRVICLSKQVKVFGSR